MALSLLREDAPAAIMGVPEDWPRWAVLLPHVLTAVGYVDDPTDQEEIAADCSWLLDRAATYLQVHAGLPERADAILKGRQVVAAEKPQDEETM